MVRVSELRHEGRGDASSGGGGRASKEKKIISDNIVDYGGWGTCLEDGVDRDALVDHLLVEIIPGLRCTLEGLGLRLGAWDYWGSSPDETHCLHRKMNPIGVGSGSGSRVGSGLVQGWFRVYRKSLGRVSSMAGFGHQRAGDSLGLKSTSAKL